MKITKDMVGKRIYLFGWEPDYYVEILAVGNEMLFGRDADGHESSWNISNPWEFYTEPKTKHRAAPALIRPSKIDYPFPSKSMFKTEEEARSRFGDYFIKWPASETSWVEWEE
jgi:hypothetical protein